MIEYAIEPKTGEILGEDVIDEKSYPDSVQFIQADPATKFYHPVWDFTADDWKEGFTTEQIEQLKQESVPKIDPTDATNAQMAKQMAQVTLSNAALAKQVATLMAAQQTNNNGGTK